MSIPWDGPAATGIGSLPGTSSREASRIIRGELPDFLHVPELPARGPGADMIGRAGAFLAEVSEDFALETTPDGWRLSRGRNRAMRRARSWLDEDLDALEEFAGGYAGPVKAQVAGPWTLAASIELASGERMLKDASACRDLAHALAEAITLHLADLHRRFPASALVMQVDEPGLPAVLAGTIGTASGLSRYRAVEEPVASASLRAVLAAAPAAHAVAGVHCCAARAPIGLIRACGADFISIDLRSDDVDEQALGLAWESGVGLLLGAVPTGRAVTDTEASRPVREVASRLGLADPRHLAHVAVTPTCGLASASPAAAIAAYASCRAASRILRDDQDARDNQERSAHGDRPRGRRASRGRAGEDGG
ncbi:MAG: hypothetical protein KGP12_08620 [Actinomycetales bacterium]|nr:hypothetical protein [Actinomycetales bacterium]